MRNLPHTLSFAMPLALLLLAYLEHRSDSSVLRAPAVATSVRSGLHVAAEPLVAVELSGRPIIVFDHAIDRREPGNFPDAQITAWKEADGTVNLMIPNAEAYRMRGPDLAHLHTDPHKIYSSSAQAEEIPEDRFDYHHWLMGPYSLDGRHFFSLAHSEWYACLLEGDCGRTASNGEPALFNAWANTVNSFVSSDGGKTWRLNTVAGNHVVAAVAHHWTGSRALAERVYLHALNHSGAMQPSRIVREGAYYYSISYYLHRDFDQIDTATGRFEAPVDRAGYVLMRTANIADPNGWQAWDGGDRFRPISEGRLKVFLPQRHGVQLEASAPQIVYYPDARCYILIHTLSGGHNAVYYMTSTTLANPVWSDSTPIRGTDSLRLTANWTLDGFNGSNYPSIIDSSSEGFNFEFTHGSPSLYFVAYTPGQVDDNGARDVYAVPLSIRQSPTSE